MTKTDVPNKDEIKNTNKKIITDLESYLFFVDLYRKDRPVKAKKYVDKVVRKESSIVSRINLLKDLDNALALPDKGEKYLNKVFKEKDSLPHEEKRPSTVQLTQNHFFNYLFFERSKMVSFGKRTKTINFKYLGIKKELSANAIVFWQQVYAEVRDLLYKQVNYAVLNGWKELDVHAYNTIATFNKFLVRFIKEGELLDRNQPISQNLKVMETFIESYLTLSLEPYYKEILKESLFEVLYTSPDFKNSVRDSMKVLDEVINSDKRTLGFFNIILAIYSLNYNKFIKRGDLFSHYNISFINEKKYEFNQKTLYEISTYLETVDSDLTNVEDELFFLKYIRDDIDSTSTPTHAWVEQFNKLCLYQNYSTRSTDKKREYIDPNAEGNPFQFIFNDNLRYICRVTDGFLNFYASILRGEVDVDRDGGKRVQIFSNDLFISEINSLEDVVKDYDYMKSSGEIISIPFDMYFHFQRHKKMQIEREEKLCQMIEKIISQYKSISKKLVAILLQHHKATLAGSESLLEKYKEQNDPIQFPGDEPRLIPYAFDRIALHKYMDKTRLNEALDQVAFFSLNILYLFRDEEVNKRHLEKETLVDKMEKLLNLKSRLSNV